MTAEQKLAALAALASELGGESWRYSRTSIFAHGYITGKGGRTIVETSSGDVPANACRFIEMADPEAMLAIAEAFDQMKQRAEAAEAIVADVEEVIGLLAEREWAEHCTETATGKRLEEAITELHNEAAPTAEHDDYFATLVVKARAAAIKAMARFPQPNYVLNKVSEEHGEVIKAVVHYMEGRETWDNVEGELVDNLAMLIRLVVEGDQVIGFTPPESVLNYQPASPAAAADLKPLEWSEERQPDEDIRYNHVIADSVLGRFSVEWKGWKEYDSRDLYLAGEHIDSFHSVDEAKAGAAAHLLKIYNSLAGKQTK